MFGNLTNIGGLIKPVAGINPANSAAATINGPGIDRAGFESLAYRQFCGSASGTPTSFTVDCKLQDSADNSTFADVSGTSATTLTAANTGAEVDIDLSNVRRYVRLVMTVAFVGGTSPAIPVAASVALGGAASLPA